MCDSLLGKGRAAVVYRSKGPGGQPAARKVFIGSSLAGLVNLLLLGSDNPYIWNRAAVQEAACRRRILAQLVAWWLPGKARVAEVLLVGWNQEHRANELVTELIEGRGVSLHHPFSADREWEYRDLLDNVMTPLQRKLDEAGFDGLLWQAGYGNPVAASNFLLEAGPGGEKRWVWIDMESGVPALFPLSPLALFRFYLPRALRYGRPMFDDVDIPRLEGYLEQHKEALVEGLGAAAWGDLRGDVAKLSEIEGGWRGMGRFERSVTGQLSRGAITSDEAAWYRRHPLRWYGRETWRGLSSFLLRARRWLAEFLAPARLKRLARGTRLFVTSAGFRSDFARGYVGKRIESWRARRQLDEAEARHLCDQLYGDESSLYIVDFGIHIAIKPLVKTFTWVVLPALYGAGVIDEVVLVAGVVSTGAIGRTLYTLPRVIATFARGSPRPWIALIVGVLPVIGNLAFPLQLLYAGAVKEAAIAKFVVYDLLALLGSAVPIWGCQDSLLELWSNRLGDFLVRSRPATLAAKSATR